MCVCSLRYPACNAHGPYCYLWPVWLYSIFPHYLINGTIFGKKIIELEIRVLISCALRSETFLILRRTERDMVKNVYLMLVVFNEAGLSLSDCRKFSNIKFNVNSSCGNPAVPCGRTDGQTHMTKLTTAFRSFACAPKNCLSEFS